MLLAAIFHAYHRDYQHPHIACWAYGFALVGTHTASGAVSIALAEQLPSIAGSRLALSVLSQFCAYAGVALIALGAAATRTLQSSRDAGIHASLNDFGTGFSSLAQLQKLPVERIKLDRSFIANPDNLERDAAIVRAMVSLAHSLELEVVAEGIETDEQHTFCTRAGVDLLQGYFFAKPLPPDRCERLIAGTEILPIAA